MNINGPQYKAGRGNTHRVHGNKTKEIAPTYLDKNRVIVPRYDLLHHPILNVSTIGMGTFLEIRGLSYILKTSRNSQTWKDIASM